MATTMESGQVNMSSNDDVEMMLVDSAVPDSDDHDQEIKIDDDLDDDLDEDDELTDDEDDDDVSNSGSGRHTPTSGLHHHRYGTVLEPRVQQHHHHHFHYFYQYPSSNNHVMTHVQTDNENILPVGSNNNINNNNNSSNTSNTTSSTLSSPFLSSPSSSSSPGLVRTISNGSMFGPINATNLVPLLTNSRYHPSLMNLNNNHNHAHANNFSTTIQPSVTPDMIPSSQHHLLSHSQTPQHHQVQPQQAPLQHQHPHHHHHHHHQQSQRNPLVQQLQQRFRPKPTSPTSLSPSSPFSPSSSSSSSPPPPSSSGIISGPNSPSSPGIGSPTSPSVQNTNTTPLFISQPSSNVQQHNGDNVHSVISSIDGTIHQQSQPQHQSNQTQTTNNQSDCPSSYHHSYSPQAQTVKEQQQQQQQQSQLHLQPQTQQTQPQQIQTSQTESQAQSQPPLVSTVPPVSNVPSIELPYTFGRSYHLISQIEASNLYLCFDSSNDQKYCCKVGFIFFNFTTI